MGGPRYNFSNRSTRTSMYQSKGVDQIFEQNRKHTAHESMIPSIKENRAHLREARDSEAYPLSLAIIICLDITGSMEDIPENMIKTGLPRMIARLKELGVEDPQILIMAIGDSRYDNNNGVFQLGQFEGGDKEMDMWLERIWISKGGGGNLGESYGWAYYYALNHVQTDAWDKRKQKGFIWTIGDDNCHTHMSKHEIDGVMGYLSKGEDFDVKVTMPALKEKWEVFHIELGECQDSWGSLLGKENVLSLGRHDYDGIADKIATAVASFTKHKTTSGPTNAESFNGQRHDEQPNQSTTKITL